MQERNMLWPPLALPFHKLGFGTMFGLALFTSAAAPAQTESEEEPATAEAVLEEVMVTGTRIKHRDFASPSPLTTVSRLEFEYSGQPTLEDYLNQMPQLMPDQSRAVNFGSDGTALLNLRGMGAGRTLVLLNGRRLAPSGVGSAVDVNNLPGVLVERAEIITGGASTVYGSDAIAGVINFITRSDFDGLSFEGGYNISEKGDAQVYDASVVYGHNFAGGDGNITAYASYTERDSLFASERELTRFVWQDDFVSGVLYMGGSPIIPGGRISRPRADFGNGPAQVTFDPDGTPRAISSPNDLWNFQPVNYLQTPLERKALGAMATLTLSGGREAYFEASYAENDATIRAAPAPAASVFQINVDNPLLTPETRELFETQLVENPGDPLVSISFTRRMLELGPRDIESSREYLRLVAGIRGEIGATWEMDAWVTWADADAVSLFRNDGSLARMQQGLLVDPATGQCFDPSGGCVPLDVFGEGRLSQAGVDFLRADDISDAASRQQALASIVFTGPAFDTWAGEAHMAFGAEWRRDKGSYKGDDALFTGDSMSWVGSASVNGTEQVYEVYSEAAIPLYDAPELGRSLGLELGARWSDYRNAGSVSTWKAGLDWQISDSLRFRAMQQRAVRAPNLAELFEQQSVLQGVAVNDFFIRSDPCSASSDPAANGHADKCVVQGLPANQVGVYEATPFYPVDFTLGGNPNLSPESSDTTTFGFVITPAGLPNLTIAVDYYDLEVTDTIGSIDAMRICFDSLNTGGVFCDNIQRDATGNIVDVFQPISNRGLLHTDGIDLQVQYETELPASWSWGDHSARLRLHAAWTHMFSNEAQENVITNTFDCVGYFARPCQNLLPGANSGASFPENRAISNLTYSAGPLDVNLTWRWIDGMRNAAEWAGPLLFNFTPILAVPEVGSYTYYDLGLGYRFSDGFELRFGVNNLFDKQPPNLSEAATDHNTDPRLYDVYGRSYFLNLRYQISGG
jgi:outer membrane receptor protein involved in Fe transport